MLPLTQTECSKKKKTLTSFSGGAILLPVPLSRRVDPEHPDPGVGVQQPGEGLRVARVPLAIKCTLCIIMYSTVGTWCDGWVWACVPCVLLYPTNTHTHTHKVHKTEHVLTPHRTCPARSGKNRTGTGKLLFGESSSATQPVSLALSLA